jgi:hypothetical protein
VKDTSKSETFIDLMYGATYLKTGRKSGSTKITAMRRGHRGLSRPGLNFPASVRKRKNTAKKRNTTR